MLPVARRQLKDDTNTHTKGRCLLAVLQWEKEQELCMTIFFLSARFESHPFCPALAEVSENNPD